LRRVVCHCDLNHNNILLSKTGQLYLIDWENAMIADPITDYGTVLNSYIPNEEWEQWLRNYGEALSEQLIMHMYWYLLMDSLSFLTLHDERKEEDKVVERIEKLADLNRKIRQLRYCFVINGANSFFYVLFIIYNIFIRILCTFFF